MPELPEVETIVQGLQKPLLGRTFSYVKINWPRAIQTPLPQFKSELIGKQIQIVGRRGKYLQFTLTQGKTLLLHLKMSGNLSVEPKAAPCHPHVRTIFGLDNGSELRFKDTRKFGRIYLVNNPADVIGMLGPEPLADDFLDTDFVALFHRRAGRLKPLLLNQTFIAGIGNIYADESCFGARLHPARSVKSLSKAELMRLYQSIRQALQQGLVYKGATFDDVYPGGQFQAHFTVYGRTGLPCVRCQTPIERIILGGRSTHFCPRCQKQRSKIEH